MLKYFIALLLLSLLFYLVDFSALLSAFTYITPGLIVLLLLVSVLMIYISCLKWNLFFASAGKKENVFKLFSLYVMSYFVNLLLPSFIGGDIARSWYAKEKGERQSSFAATLMERLTGFIAMAGLATIALFFLADARIEFITVVAISIVALLFISWVLVSKKLLNFLSGFKFFNKTATKLIPLQDLIRKFFYRLATTGEKHLLFLIILSGGSAKHYCSSACCRLVRYSFNGVDSCFTVNFIGFSYSNSAEWPGLTGRSFLLFFNYDWCQPRRGIRSWAGNQS